MKKENYISWNKKYLALCCLLQTVYGAFSMYFAVVLNRLVTTVSTTADLNALKSVGLYTLFFGIAYPVFRAVADALTKAYGERAAEALRGRISRSVFSMNASGFAEQDTGDYLNSLTGDVLLLHEQYYSQVPLLFCYVSQFISCVIYSIYLNPIVALVLMVMSAVQYFVPTALGKKVNQYTLVQSKVSAAFTSKVKELLLGFSVIKSYGGESSVQNEFDMANRKMADKRVKVSATVQILRCTNMLIAMLMILLSVLTAAYFVLRGDMLPATLLTVFYIANRYSMPVMDFAGACVQIKGSQGVREKLNAFLAAHPEAVPAESKPIQKDVTVKHLRFSYSEDAPALNDISFSFEMGKKYLIVGESGCGKSTLLKLLSKQYPSHGVYIDGMPLEEIPEGQLAGKMVLVGQQPYVFRRTVGGNIDFLGTGDRAKLMEAAEKCCLSDFLSTLPQGIDTLVDEEQRQLSGGQKARIGLARALYTQPDVLLLDEVTGALDPETAMRIEEMILTLKNTLVIHISHKPNPELTRQYDGVLTLDNGRLVNVKLRQS